jgi:hypothetical protein
MASADILTASQLTCLAGLAAIVRGAADGMRDGPSPDREA